MSRSTTPRAQLNLLRGPESARSRPVLALIPGGPGLSSRSLEGAELLARSFDVALIDPPGTGGSPEGDARPEFETFVDALLAAIAALRRPVVVCGHSFGGYYALGCVERAAFPVKGLVLISTPLTPRTYAAATKQYERHQDDALTRAERRWEAQPSEETFRAWVASYGVLFFGAAVRDKGRDMILRDRTSYRSCQAMMGLMSDERFSAALLEKARRYAGPKLFIAGADDLLYPMEHLKQDAASVPMDFYAVPKAGHFPTLENPEEVARAFERTFGARETLEVP